MDMYHQAEAILMSDMPIIPIVFYADDVLSQTYFTGFGVSGTGPQDVLGCSKNEISQHSHNARAARRFFCELLFHFFIETNFLSHCAA